MNYPLIDLQKDMIVQFNCESITLYQMYTQKEHEQARYYHHFPQQNGMLQ